MSFIKYSAHAFGHVCVVYVFCWRSHLLALCHRREKAAESRQLVSSKQPADPIRLGMKISFYLLPFLSFSFYSLFPLPLCRLLRLYLFFISSPIMFSIFFSSHFFQGFLLIVFFPSFFFSAFPACNSTFHKHHSRLQLLYLP